MATVRKTVVAYQCERCGHEWQPNRATPPAVCSKCKSPNWKRPRLRDIVEKNKKTQRVTIDFDKVTDGNVATINNMKPGDIVNIVTEDDEWEVMVYPSRSDCRSDSLAISRVVDPFIKNPDPDWESE